MKGCGGDSEPIENSEDLDIDTDLLCPDIIMEISNEVITENEANQSESASINSSRYDYNITGAKAHFELNPMEEHLRNYVYGQDPDSVKYSKIHCTACNIHLGSALDQLENVFIHPMLLVIICKECFDYYLNGTFEKDEDGSEMYCRWCGQGGDVLCCSVCPMVFCKLCIKINFSANKYTEIRKNDDWRCFSCQPNQIMSFKVQCYEYAKYVQTKMCISDSETADNFLKTDFTLCCSPTKRRKRKNSCGDDPDYYPAEKDELEEEEDDSTGNNTKIKVMGQETGNTQFVISTEPQTSVVDTKHRVALVSENNDNVNPKTDIIEVGVSKNQQPAAVSTPVYSNTPVSTNVFKTPIGTIPKVPRKSIILFKTDDVTVANNSGQKSITLKAQPQTKIIMVQKSSLEASTNLLGTNKVAMDENKIAADTEKSRKTIEKIILDTSLANGTFGSSILQLEHNFRKSDGDGSGSLVALYNSCQEAMSTMIGGLLEVKKEHILTNVSRGTNSKLVSIKNCKDKKTSTSQIIEIL